MMTALPGEWTFGDLFMSDEIKKRKRKKKLLEEFLPQPVRDKSEAFIEMITGEVDIYKKIRMINGLPENREADEFSAWWSLGRYHHCPEILILFYDHWDELNVNNSDLVGTFEGAQQEMIRLYRFAKENNFIKERV